MVRGAAAIRGRASGTPWARTARPWAVTCPDLYPSGSSLYSMFLVSGMAMADTTKRATWWRGVRPCAAVRPRAGPSPIITASGG